MLVRNGIAPRARIPEKPSADKETLDAVADLQDWLTDSEQGNTTGVGGEALVAVRQALIEGESAFNRKAYGMVSLLKERNSYTLGQDIPANHASTNGPNFRCVCETLQSILLDRIQGQHRSR